MTAEERFAEILDDDDTTDEDTTDEDAIAEDATEEDAAEEETTEEEVAEAATEEEINFQSVLTALGTFEEITYTGSGDDVITLENPGYHGYNVFRRKQFYRAFG